MDDELKPIDHSAIKVNQALIMSLCILAFVLDLAWLAAFVGLAMIAGAVLGKPAFYWVYRYVLRPLDIAKPDIRMDNPEPHRFAQGFGGVVLGIGSLALFLGATILGWALVWLMAALTALNLFVGFCMGCAMYYWLARLNVPGFSKHSPPGTLPGVRSKMKVN